MTVRVEPGELRQFVEQWERLDAERSDIVGMQKDVMAQAKLSGYDTNAMRKVIALRKMDKDARDEAQAMQAMYAEALGL